MSLRLGQDLAKHLAVLADLEACQVIGPLRDQLAKTAQESRSPDRRDPRPPAGVERRPGGRDGRGDIRLARRRQHCPWLTVDGTDQ